MFGHKYHQSPVPDGAHEEGAQSVVLIAVPAFHDSALVVESGVISMLTIQCSILIKFGGLIPGPTTVVGDCGR